MADLTNEPLAQPTSQVVQVLQKRLRAAKKKLNRIQELESLQAQGKKLTSEQMPTVNSKPGVVAVIEELSKMEEALKDALREEVDAAYSSGHAAGLDEAQAQTATREHELISSMEAAAKEQRDAEVQRLEEEWQAKLDQAVKDAREEADREASARQPTAERMRELLRAPLLKLLQLLYFSQLFDTFKNPWMARQELNTCLSYDERQEVTEDNPRLTPKDCGDLAYFARSLLERMDKVVSHKDLLDNSLEQSLSWVLEDHAAVAIPAPPAERPICMGQLHGRLSRVLASDFISVTPVVPDAPPAAAAGAPPAAAQQPPVHTGGFPVAAAAAAVATSTPPPGAAAAAPHHAGPMALSSQQSGGSSSAPPPPPQPTMALLGAAAAQVASNLPASLEESTPRAVHSPAHVDSPSSSSHVARSDAGAHQHLPFLHATEHDASYGAAHGLSNGTGLGPDAGVGPSASMFPDTLHEASSGSYDHMKAGQPGMDDRSSGYVRGGNRGARGMMGGGAPSRVGYGDGLQQQQQQAGIGGSRPGGHSHHRQQQQQQQSYGSSGMAAPGGGRGGSNRGTSPHAGGGYMSGRGGGQQRDDSWNRHYANAPRHMQPPSMQTGL